MKVLLFTHRTDIDGLGGAVLGKLSFDDLKYELCTVYDINDRVESYLNSSKIDEYEQVFITDLRLKEPLLSRIDENPNWRDKTLIFDHHKVLEGEFKKKYKWLNIKYEDDNGMCCGTSLFYDYLINNDYLIPSPVLERFKELTRRYDTWEWATKYNDEQARELTILMDLIGEEKYISWMYDKLASMSTFEFSELERDLIDVEKEKIRKYVEAAISDMITKEIDGNKVGFVFTEQYRNEIAEELKTRRKDLKYVALINGYHSQISYRSIDPNFDVNTIAYKHGGRGHKVASSSPITDSQKNAIIDLLAK